MALDVHLVRVLRYWDAEEEEGGWGGLGDGVRYTR